MVTPHTLQRRPEIPRITRQLSNSFDLISHVNFAITSHLVVVPTFGSPHDSDGVTAIAALALAEAKVSQTKGRKEKSQSSSGETAFDHSATTVPFPPDFLTKAATSEAFN